MTTFVTPQQLKDIEHLRDNTLVKPTIYELFDELNPINLGYKYPAIGDLIRTFKSNSSITPKFETHLNEFYQQLIDYIIYDIEGTFTTLDVRNEYTQFSPLSIEILLYSNNKIKERQNG